MANIAFRPYLCRFLLCFALLILPAGCFLASGDEPDSYEIPLSTALVGNEQHIIGKAYVIDGDSLRVRRTELRLWGLDAPEWQQECLEGDDGIYPCGKRAKTALRDILAPHGYEVACSTVQSKPDIYGRPLVYCEAGGQDIVAEMIRRGWAVRYEQSAPPNPPLYKQYGMLRNDARRMRLGLWAGCFTDPRAWRRGDRRCPGKI